MATTLSDLGERRLLREVIPRFVEGAGSDCAIIRPQGATVVVTTDPVPRPAAEVIGGDRDPYWLGWLLVTINASDIAASGARPDSFVAALDLPGDYLLSDFERLLFGIQSSCRANHLKYVGGNLRESNVLAGVGTAFGSTNFQPLTRAGLKVGDSIYVLGAGGRFWTDVSKLSRGAEIDKRSSPLFSPISQSPIMHVLHEQGLARCAMDTSDGLAPTLEELALVNELTLEIDVRSMCVTGECDEEVRNWFGWGGLDGCRRSRSIS